MNVMSYCVSKNASLTYVFRYYTARTKRKKACFWVHAKHNIIKNTPMTGFQAFAGPAMGVPSMVTGHLPLGACALLKTPGNCFYATMIREPISRYVSAFYHGHAQASAACRKCHDINYFVQQTQLILENKSRLRASLRERVLAMHGRLDNPHTKFLSGEAFWTRVGAAPPGHVGTPPRKLRSEDLYSMAVTNLKSLAVLGILDDYSTFVDDLYGFFGLTYTAARIPHINKGDKPTPLTNQSIAILQSILKWDIDLYAEALQEHARRKAGGATPRPGKGAILGVTFNATGTAGIRRSLGLDSDSD